MKPLQGCSCVRRCLAAAALTLTAVFGAHLVAAGDPPAAAAPVDDRHDVVFLAEARPILIRMHVALNGKPVQPAWDGFIDHLFAFLDVNGDGVLSKEEAERTPPVDQILSGGLGRAFGGLGMGKMNAIPTLADLDADKDGQVTRAELAAYYRKNGFLPLQIQPDTGPANPLSPNAILGGQRFEPTVEQVAEAIFALLDTNNDGKVSRDELAAAPGLLLQRDEDDDEMLTPAEVAPNAKPTANAFAGMMAMGMGGANNAKPPKTLVALPSPGESTPLLARRLHEVYDPGADRTEEPKLTRAKLGLDEATFKQLDTNGDGVLDSTELAGFVKRTPDIELAVQTGSMDAGATAVTRIAGAAEITNGLARLNLGRTRVDLRSDSSRSYDQIAGILRQQFLAQFKQADKANRGYLDRETAKARSALNSLFHAMDRDGDGKLYEHEVVAYPDQLTDLQQRARAACVTLALTNHSRGLFDLLDTNRDGRLSVREMRAAVNLLDTLRLGQKGYLERTEVPHSYQLSVRPGPARAGAGGAGILALYSRSDRPAAVPEPMAGPMWFRKMDRNRDGDVSRREFLGTDAQFRQMDTDGDGLISAEEADRFDTRQRR